MNSVAGFENCLIAPSDQVWVLVVASIVMATMGFMIGANDMANVLATSIGSKALNLFQASVLGMIFIIIGSVFLGSKVSSTIRSDILALDTFEANPAVLMFGMTTSLMAASIWLYFATRMGWPVSTTHSITGALIGMGIANRDNSVDWAEVQTIVLSWFFSPILAAILGSIFFYVIRAIFLRSNNSVSRSYKFLAILLFLIFETFILSFMLQTSIIFGFACPQEVDGEIISVAPCVVEDWVLANPIYGILVSMAISVVLTAIAAGFAYPYFKRQMKAFSESQKEQTKANFMTTWNKALYVDVHEQSYKEDKYSYEMHQRAEEFKPETEKFFSILQVLSACFDTLALGASDIANTAGPFASVLSIYQMGYVVDDVDTPMYILFIASIFIALGIGTMGYHVVKTLGVKLVFVSPSRGFCIEMSSAWVILFFTNLGIPLSSTHCQVGATIGVGLIEKRYNSTSMLSKIFGKGVNWKVFAYTALSWVLTIVIAATLSGLLYSFGVYAPSVIYG